MPTLNRNALARPRLYVPHLILQVSLLSVFDTPKLNVEVSELGISGLNPGAR
jgi:hypothetical protein